MINTDKYEGHTEGKWRVDDEIGLVIKHGQDPHDFVDMENKANAQLMADAPLLLEEVKRLREQYTELREALVGDSPNWTHEELIGKALELQKENKILAKYMDIVQKYDDALLADGDTDPRWSELYD